MSKYSMGFIGERVRYVREQRGLDASELGKLVGKSQGYISKVENGEFEFPSSRFVIKLCLALECRSDFLFGLTDTYEIYTYTDAINHLLKPLTLEQQEHCLNMIEMSSQSFMRQSIRKNIKPVEKLPYEFRPSHFKRPSLQDL